MLMGTHNIQSRNDEQSGNAEHESELLTRGARHDATGAQVGVPEIACSLGTNATVDVRAGGRSNYVGLTYPVAHANLIRRSPRR